MALGLNRHTYLLTMTDMPDQQTISPTLQAIRAQLDLTQEQLAERLGVSFATVNRWEGGVTTPQRAARTAIAALAAEAGVDDGTDTAVNEAESAARVTREAVPATAGRPFPSTKPMEQMLWDAACSIRGEKDAAKFKDYLLPLLFLKRLSDVFDDEVDRMAEEYRGPGDRSGYRGERPQANTLLRAAGGPMGHRQWKGGLTIGPSTLRDAARDPATSAST